jgi:hypothetical protein
MKLLNLIRIFIYSTSFLIGDIITQAENFSTTKDLKILAQQAISENKTEADAAILKLRENGAMGLDALFDTHSELLSINYKLREPGNEQKFQRLKVALDSVSKQRDSYTSHLYWYTDLEKAKELAKATGKPILSLRLLGNLNEEYSCANSRFFRTALYANENISKYLRQHFVLHWKSVRPIPKVTIDFGDGRKLVPTITGNSVHYILTPDGRPVDALPGLYGPGAFFKRISEAEGVVQEYSKLDSRVQRSFLKNYHKNKLIKTEEEWSGDYDKLASKSKLLPAPRTFLELKSSTNSDNWKEIASFHHFDSILDNGSIQLMQVKNPLPAAEASKLAMSKMAIETPFMRLINNFQRSMAEDSVRNEYLFHSEIHRWFASENFNQDLDVLNEKVYTELFLTPSSDPWLGLIPKDTYSALDNNGS